MGVTVDKCLQGWTNSLRQMNARADIVFFGDSLTYYGDFASVFPDKVVCNLGLRGDTIQGMIDRVEQVKVLEPKQVFLMAGINDVAKITIEDFGKQYKALVSSLKVLLPQSVVLIQSLLPVNDRDFAINCNSWQVIDCNRVIERIAAENNLKYIDLFYQYADNMLLPEHDTIDGLHLIEKSYQKWFQSLKF